ncbi:unnamed protein product [Eruca vesicaria subsp. sativa]|uniref:Uncharacterized protein n=1 Tax=Eruca vesicaria subsp. sativa TaxID=29727 RepID=A0ABC8LYJ6_ERUVS|nr:unnamed protein product [Eruca vesicaria subsp. sativa]
MSSQFAALIAQAASSLSCDGSSQKEMKKRESNRKDPRPKLSESVEVAEGGDGRRRREGIQGEIQEEEKIWRSRRRSKRRIPTMNVPVCKIGNIQSSNSKIRYEP